MRGSRIAKPPCSRRRTYSPVQDMIESRREMAHADTPGNYIEIDTQQDFELAQNSWRG